MDIAFNCPACGQHLTVDQEGTGLSIPCPTCGTALTVPEAVAPANTPPVEIPSETSSSPPATSEGASAIHGVSLVIAPFQWIARGVTDGLRGAPVLFVGFLCALFIYCLGALLCLGDFFVFGPLLCGIWAVALGISRREPGSLGRISDGFSVFWRAVGLGLLWMLIGMVANGLAWGLFLLSALLLPGAWVPSALLCALLGSYPAWRLGFAAPLLVDRKLLIGQSLAGSWRMTSSLPMHLAWIVFVFYGLVLGMILGGGFVLVGGLFGVGVSEAVKASNDPSQVFAAFGSTVFVLAFLALLLVGVWIAVILMALAHGYLHMLRRLEGTDTANPAERVKEASPVPAAWLGGGLGCPQCHQQVEVGARFCSHCGFLVADCVAQAQVASQVAPAGQDDESGSNAAIMPAQGGSLAPVSPAAMAVTQVQPVHLPTVAMHSWGRVEIGAPVSSAEETLWQGRQSFWFYVPMITQSFLWFLVWCYCASSVARWLTWITAHQPPELQQTLRTLQPVVATYSWAFYGPAALALWGIARSILNYFNAYFLITTQRVRMRTGLFAQTITQIELFRLKDIALRKSLWGRVCNYGHILLISSDRLMGEVTLRGLPQAEAQLEAIRWAAQRARAQSGIVNISE